MTETRNYCSGGSHWTSEPVVHCTEGWEDDITWTDSWCPRHISEHSHLGDTRCEVNR